MAANSRAKDKSSKAKYLSQLGEAALALSRFLSAAEVCSNPSPLSPTFCIAIHVYSFFNPFLATHFVYVSPLIQFPKTHTCDMSSFNSLLISHVSCGIFHSSTCEYSVRYSDGEHAPFTKIIERQATCVPEEAGPQMQTCTSM
jgi:hypothetical protein